MQVLNDKCIVLPPLVQSAKSVYKLCRLIVYTCNYNILIYQTDSISVAIASSSPSVMYGKDVTLTATISSEILVKSIEWQRVSNGFTTSLDINQLKYNQTGGIGSDTITLTITGVTFVDEGSYQVQVINNANVTKTSSLVSLDVTGGICFVHVLAHLNQRLK